MNWLSNKLFYTIGITLLSGGLHAQSLAEAKKLYNEGKYAEAKPAFEKLVKQAPSNSSYNHWYGVCCYETGDLTGAEKHLKVAVKRKVQEAYRYMSEVYYKTYRSDEAGEMLEEYINLLAKKKQDPQSFETKLDLANNAQRMMEKVEDVQIIDSLVVDKDDFLSAYILSEESGTLDSYKDFFQTNEPVNSTVYKNQKGDKIYYAHSTDGDRYCLFTQSMLMDEWGDEKQLPMNINSNDDDNYPFVLSDGATIYYSSKGNGSIGGYDLFVTRYNINSDTYLAPEQLGMPFNSPYNDYMYVIDEFNDLGWFASDRYQPEGKVCIYVFIPNSSKQVYNYEGMDPDKMISLAQLHSIKDTWTDTDAVKAARERLRTAANAKPRTTKKHDFQFIIDDHSTYYQLDDFRSPQAKASYGKYNQLEQSYKQLQEKLEDMRSEYSRANKQEKDKMSAAILDLEQRVRQLSTEMEQTAIQVRNLEKQATK